MYNRATEENINKVLFMREKNLRETNNNNKTLKRSVTAKYICGWISNGPTGGMGPAGIWRK